jgi:hypothetical protein
MSIMIQAESFNDAALALSYLQQQIRSSRDQRLREMLELRVIRLRGLVDLRSAQQRYEKKHGPLTSLEQLVVGAELTSLPEDPLQLGYELRDGRIELKKLKIMGLEE